MKVFEHIRIPLVFHKFSVMKTVLLLGGFTCICESLHKWKCSQDKLEKEPSNIRG